MNNFFTSKLKHTLTFSLAVTMCASTAKAQLSSNRDKFLGNITTSYNVDYGNEKYHTLWNQITCENESKWGSIEGTNNNFNWGGSDNAYNYAKNHKFPFKFHALVWGSQYPKWIESQTPAQRYKEIVQWMDAVKKRYPNLQLIDVVNEAISGHQAGTPYFIEALGGTGKTGYDWIIKAFELAYERWPDAILIYNDFNTFQWNTDQYIDLVKTLRDAGTPIDAYGCQSHDLTDCDITKFKQSMTKIQKALKMPMYSTEYDIGTSDDDLQLKRYKEQIPYMWESDYVAGITLWGYIYGRTWTTDGNSGIIKNGKDRPAMTWLREYMKTDKAKNAKSPFPGMVKEASVYIKPASLNIEKNAESTITVRARMKTKTIEKVDLYAKGSLIASMTDGENGLYTTTYTPTTHGSQELKAVVTTTDGETWTRYSTINVCNPRAPYKNKPAELPGIVQFENFDSGADGIAFHDNNSQKQGDAASYRTDTGGIDIIKCTSGYGVGWTEVGEWMEYTVNVKEAGLYSYDIYYAAPENGARFSISLSSADGQTLLTDEKQPLAKTGSWSTYKTAHGRLLLPLEAGQQIIRFSITGSGDGQYVANLDKMTFKRVVLNESIVMTLATDTKTGMVDTETAIKADVDFDEEIQNVKFYIDGILYKTVNSAPYETAYTPKVKGEHIISAIATDADGRQSTIQTCILNVSPKRVPFKGVVDLPGIIEAENFDKGEEGFTFHDSDNKDEGNASYRTDNGGVDIVKCDGGYAIGYTAKGEWLEYSVNVTTPGKYKCIATVSSGTTGGAISLGDVTDGKTKTLCRITVPKTGDNTWDIYKNVSATISTPLTEGNHILRLNIVGANCNIDKLEMVCIQPEDTGINDLETNKEAAGNTTHSTNLMGMPVDNSYNGIIIKNGKKYLNK